MGKNKPACLRAHFLGPQTAMKREFNAAHTPLENGFTVIEASAGTGKTTTIAAIVLRFLAEKGIPIERILVTTYTEDTTMAALLRERLKPAQLVELLTQLTNNPTLRVVPPPEDRAVLEKRIAELCEAGADSGELTELVNRFVVSVQSEFCEWASEQLPRRKADRGVQSFDDLLARLDEALRREEGGELRNSLHERFAVALVDEFQDTDPVQYSIFSQIYGGSDSSVFFIGDPKQAIYGFRGADVFTYLEAAKVANRRYTLERNWRSEAKLLHGVNAIFRRRDNPFVIEDIDLSPVTASGKADAEPLTLGGRRDQPLRFWIASTDDKARVEEAVAAEIASLLAGETKIGERKIELRDIAVMVNNNTQPV